MIMSSITCRPTSVSNSLTASCMSRGSCCMTSTARHIPSERLSPEYAVQFTTEEAFEDAAKSYGGLK